jgi:hypothetical protein
LRLAGCELTATTPSAQKRVSFDFPDACKFSKDRSGKVHVATARTGRVVLVEASKPLPSAYPGSKDCDTRVRAVVVSGNEVALSEKTSKVASCGPGAWDDLMFQSLADRTVPLTANDP